MLKLITLLIIDDSPEDREAYKRLLSSADFVEYHFKECDCGEDCLAFLQNESVDCVLLDYNLPDMDGIEILEKLAEQEGSDTPVIFLTGQGNETIAVQAMKNGATDYLVKTDINGKLLNRSIHYAIDKKDSDQKLRHYVLELEKANTQILKQQKAVIEEERLKVILQMAGATAHEMNQPLMTMLGSIELLYMKQEVPDSIKKYMTRIWESGNRISSIVKKIQAVKYHDTQTYAGGREIIKLDRTLNLLVVENNDVDSDILMRVLSEIDGVKANRLSDIDQACQLSTSADLIITNYMLPSGTGVDLLKRLEEKGANIPVIIVSTAGSETIASEVIQAGAYDHLPKAQLNVSSLNRAIHNALDKHRLKNEAVAAVKKMAEMSTTDALTGLFNRRYFHDALKNEISRSHSCGSDFAIFIANLDHFKIINDTHGHSAGDRVLKETALILKNCLRQGDIPCRYGGEEMAVIMPNTSGHQGITIGERFRKALSEKPIIWKGTPIRVKTSIGIAAFRKQSNESPELLIQKADQALYKAKSQGRNRVCAENCHL